MHVIERVLVEVVSPVFAGAFESEVGLNPDGSASERPFFGTCAGFVSHAECLALDSCVTWGLGGWPPPEFELWHLPRVHVCAVYCVRVWVGTSLLRIINCTGKVYQPR